MKYRRLANTGVYVSELCLGAMTFGGYGPFQAIGALGQAEADVLVHRALDAGINFFDTANVYSAGQSEEMLGAALGTRRRDVIVATKVRGRMGDGPNEIGLSRVHVLQQCEASLRRLGTDYIDLYQIHGPDPVTDIRETLEALTDLVRAGKVRYIGCSNLSAWQLMQALGLSRQHRLAEFVSTQSYYSATPIPRRGACRSTSRRSTRRGATTSSTSCAMLPARTGSPWPRSPSPGSSTSPRSPA